MVRSDQSDLFSAHGEAVTLAEQAFLLRGFALKDADAVLDALHAVTLAAPLRHFVKPGGQTMSVAMTNCGKAGWVSDRRVRDGCRRHKRLSDKPKPRELRDLSSAWSPYRTVASWYLWRVPK